MPYKLLARGVRRLADGAEIPPDSGNADWREYQKWLAAGNTPQPADPVPAPIDQSDLDNMQKAIKVAILLARKWCNEIKAGTYATKTVADAKQEAKQIWDSLP